MSGTDISALVGMMSGIIALFTLVIAYFTYSRNRKKDDEKHGERNGQIASDIKYIKEGIDELKGDSRRTKDELVELGQRVSKVEESSKQAHKRIDELAKKVS